ncbi:hypothetical protein Acr_28g0011690 [Actinidia rufa]|uniref:Uncharacterized protein n=1 Tax=Actinidia rufa TaxID=165716 RepID=A0A7J0HCK4_9ERIC|nr:hypothetical protein Acr_28g0011690 [Actinidia rufa]
MEEPTEPAKEGIGATGEDIIDWAVGGDRHTNRIGGQHKCYYGEEEEQGVQYNNCYMCMIEERKKFLQWGDSTDLQSLFSSRFSHYNSRNLQIRRIPPRLQPPTPAPASLRHLNPHRQRVLRPRRDCVLHRPLPGLHGSLPTPSPANKSPSPAPSAPGDAGTVKSHVNDGGEEQNESSGGLGGGQKAGIALGVVAGVCLVALGGILYRKRQQNIQRSQHGYAARRDIL